MTFDELRDAWQASNRERSALVEREQLVARAGRGVERLWAKVFRRDMIETIAAVFVIWCFGRYFLRFEEPLPRLGAAVVVLAAVRIIVKMHRTRADWARSPIDAPIREFCRTEIGRIDRQIELHRTILWWYIAPILLGVNFISFGISGGGWGSIGYSLFTLLFGWWLYKMNTAVIGKQFLPLREELSALLGDLSQDATSPQDPGSEGE